MIFIRAAGVKSAVNNKGNMLNAADPFFEITNPASGECVARSVVLFNDMNPQWPPIKVSTAALGNKSFLLSFYDYQRMGDHILIGSIETSIDEMKQAAKNVQAQRGVQLLDKKESYTLGDADSDRPRVYIYDVISTTGIPSSFTTSYKQKSPNGSLSSPSVSSYSGSTEPETDFSSSDGDRTFATMSPTDDQGSVCPSIDSNDSTVVTANGTAPPRPVRRAVKKKKKRMGKTLLVGGIMPKILVGGFMPTLNEEDDEKLVSPGRPPAADPKQEAATVEAAPKIIEVSCCPIMTEAELRGAKMAKQEAPDKGAPKLDVCCGSIISGSIMSGSINDFDSLVQDDVSTKAGDDDDVSHHDAKDDASTQESTVRTDEVFELLEEIDKILTGFNQEYRERRKSRRPLSTKPPKTRNRIAGIMGGVGRGAMNVTTTSTRLVTKSSSGSSVGLSSRPASISRSASTTSRSTSGGSQASRSATTSSAKVSKQPASRTSTRSTASSSGASFSSNQSPPKLQRRRSTNDSVLRT
jgi:hypothetical protein